MRLGGRPNSRLLLITGIVCFAGGMFVKHSSHLKKCHCCLEKLERDATQCWRCGFDLPANTVESLSQPFYKKSTQGRGTVPLEKSGTIATTGTAWNETLAH
jgi:predicted amidophosphoribosyltransferase